jgi:hypothetical protein
VAAACLCEPPWHEPALEVERILMMDYAPARAQSKGVISTPSRGWGLAEAAVAKSLSASPSPITNVVDKLSHQLVEIHAIAATQLA